MGEASSMSEIGVERSDGSSLQISAAEVAGWFRRAARRGPCPDEEACEALARRLEQYRAAEGCVPTAQRKKGDDLKPLTKTGRAFLRELEKYIAEVEANIENERLFNEGTAVDIEFQWLAPLREIEEAMNGNRYVWEKFVRTHQDWHNWANFIAQRALELWSVSGRTTFGRDPCSPLVKFVIEALVRTTGRHHRSDAVAKALQRIPAMNSVLGKEWVIKRILLQ
jgi:hypothetical protein